MLYLELSDWLCTSEEHPGFDVLEMNFKKARLRWLGHIKGGILDILVEICKNKKGKLEKTEKVVSFCDRKRCGRQGKMETDDLWW